jgi:hypothetical protein
MPDIWASKSLVSTVQYGTLYKTVPADRLAQLSANISHWTALLQTPSRPCLVGRCRGHWPTRPPRVLVLCCRRVYSDCSTGPPGCVHFVGISLVGCCRRNPRACWQLVKELVGRCLHLSGVWQRFRAQLNTTEKARQVRLLEQKKPEVPPVLSSFIIIWTVLLIRTGFNADPEPAFLGIVADRYIFIPDHQLGSRIQH